jgi:hypothetical protein
MGRHLAPDDFARRNGQQLHKDEPPWVDIQFLDFPRYNSNRLRQGTIRPKNVRLAGPKQLRISFPEMGRLPGTF